MLPMCLQHAEQRNKNALPMILWQYFGISKCPRCAKTTGMLREHIYCARRRCLSWLVLMTPPFGASGCGFTVDLTQILSWCQRKK